MFSRSVAAYGGGAVLVGASVPSTREQLDELTSGLVRGLRTLSVAAKVAIDYKLLGVLHSDADPEDYTAAQSRVHKRSAESLVALARAHAGVYTKGGQYLSTNNHVLPREWTDALSVLTDKASSQPFTAVKQVWSCEMDGALEDSFQYVEEEAIASASLAQVHRAITKDGQHVALKVQYPGLPAQVSSDLITIQVALFWLAAIFPAFDLQWLLPQFKDNVQWELDFAQEGLNATRSRLALKAHAEEHGGRAVHVPVVRWDLTSTRVICTEWIEGCRATDLEALAALGVPRQELAACVSETFGVLAFEEGLLHADPHAGNLLVQRRPGAAPLPDTIAPLNPPLGQSGPLGPFRRSPLDEAQATARTLACVAVGTLAGAGVVALSCVAAVVAVVTRTKRAVTSMHEEHQRKQGVDVDAAKEQSARKLGRSREERMREMERRHVLELRAKEKEASTGPAPKAGLPANADWQLVVLDHGMYMRLQPAFRRHYVALWRALIERDPVAGEEALRGLGFKNTQREFEIFSLLFVYSPSSSTGKVGQHMTKEERQELRMRLRRGGDLHMGVEDISPFLRSLPADLLFSMRNVNIVRGLNKTLGGTTHDRINAMLSTIQRGVEVHTAALGPAALADLSAVARGQLDEDGYLVLSPEAVLRMGGEDVPERLPSLLFPSCALNSATDSEMARMKAVPLRTTSGGVVHVPTPQRADAPSHYSLWSSITWPVRLFFARALLWMYSDHVRQLEESAIDHDDPTPNDFG